MTTGTNVMRAGLSVALFGAAMFGISFPTVKSWRSVGGIRTARWQLRFSQVLCGSLVLIGAITVVVGLVMWL